MKNKEFLSKIAEMYGEHVVLRAYQSEPDGSRYIDLNAIIDMIFQQFTLVELQTAKQYLMTQEQDSVVSSILGHCNSTLSKKHPTVVDKEIADLITQIEQMPDEKKKKVIDMMRSLISMIQQ